MSTRFKLGDQVRSKPGPWNPLGHSRAGVTGYVAKVEKNLITIKLDGTPSYHHGYWGFSPRHLFGGNSILEDYLELLSEENE